MALRNAGGRGIVMNALRRTALLILVLFILQFSIACAATDSRGDDGLAVDRTRPRALLMNEAPYKETGIVVYTLARRKAASGDIDAALALLEQLYSKGWPFDLESADFLSLRDDPRYATLARAFRERATKVSGSSIVTCFAASDLMPEGSAWDGKRKEIAISSGHLRKVIAVNEAGDVRDIIEEGEAGVFAVLGMEIDAERRLWIASTAAPFMKDYSETDAGRAAVHSFDVDTGRNLGAWFSDINPALFNDIAVAPDGRFFVTDTVNNRIVVLDTETGKLQPLHSDLPLQSPNGIAYAGKGNALFVADFRGLTRIDLSSGQQYRLDLPAAHPSLGGIDGLEYADSYLVGIQNLAGSGQVWKVTLNDAETEIRNVELLEAGSPLFANPTTGVVTKTGFRFLANPALGSPGYESNEECAGEFIVLTLPL